MANEIKGRIDKKGKENTYMCKKNGGKRITIKQNSVRRVSTNINKQQKEKENQY